MKPNIHFINNIAPHYMGPLLLQLFESKLINLRFSCGRNPHLNINAIEFDTPEFSPYYNRTHTDLKNVWIKKKYLIWQHGVILNCLSGKKVDLIILLGEFTVLSNWIAAIICRMRNIPVAFRGHGIYGNESKLKMFLRTSYYKLGNYQLVYERRAKKLLIDQGFNKNDIHVVFNSLDYDYNKSQREELKKLDRSKVYDFFDDNNLQTIIFTGRLTKSKKLEMLLKAVEKINSVNKNSPVNLLIIGDGEEKKNLEVYANDKLPKGTYHFYGSCYDEAIMGRFLSKADLCVSPGNVGLTAIHSLSFGTPVCTHHNFSNQGPEAEAILENKTGVFFEENNIDDLFQKINAWLLKYPKKTDEVIINCYQIIDEYYNPYFQEKVFYNIAVKNEPII